MAPLVCAFCILLLLGAPALGGWISVGVKGGAPFSESSGQRSGCLKIVCSDTRLSYLRYAVGPSLEVNLKWGLALESGFLYRRYHEDRSSVIGPIVILANTYESTALPVWDVPLLIKYRFGTGRWQPFAGAGGTLQWKGEGIARTMYIDHFYPDRPGVVTTSETTLEGEFTGGISGSGGIARVVGRTRLSGEVRVTHWTTIRRQPVENEVLVLVGFAF